MKNFDLNKIKEKMAREFFFYKYYRYNNTYDFIPDEFVLKVIKGDFGDVFTDEELSYIHYVLGISSESKLRNSGNAKSNIVLKLNYNLNEFRCQKKGETLIEVLNLSKRCYSALHGYDIISVEQLIMCSKEELNNIRNLGKILIEEIIDKVHEYGLKFYFEYTKEEQISYLLYYNESINQYKY